MTYRIFISTSPDCADKVERVQTALFQMDDFPITAVAAGETGTDALNLAEMRRLIASAHVFIGIYGHDYGPMVPEANASLAEWAYREALERGLSCLIFMPEMGSEQAEARMHAWQRDMAQRHVIHRYSDAEDLQARVVLALNSYRKSHGHQRQLRPAAQGFQPEAAPPAPAPTEDLQAWVDRALALAEDDIETIVRRALTLHDARQHVERYPRGYMQVRPIFGAPSPNSQFQADVFMVMPFRERFDGIYERIVRPTVADLNLTIKRGDEFASVNGVVIQEVWAALNACRIVIAETTEVNANVYYELGIAHTLGKPVILLTQHTDADDLPFDIRHRRFILYEDSIEGGESLGGELRESLIWILNDLDEMAGGDAP